MSCGSRQIMATSICVVGGARRTRVKIHLYHLYANAQLAMARPGISYGSANIAELKCANAAIHMAREAMAEGAPLGMLGIAARAKQSRLMRIISRKFLVERSDKLFKLVCLSHHEQILQ